MEDEEFVALISSNVKWDNKHFSDSKTADFVEESSFLDLKAWLRLFNKNNTCELTNFLVGVIHKYL